MALRILRQTGSPGNRQRGNYQLPIINYQLPITNESHSYLELETRNPKRPLRSACVTEKKAIVSLRLNWYKISVWTPELYFKGLSVHAGCLPTFCLHETAFAGEG